MPKTVGQEEIDIFRRAKEELELILHLHSTLRRWHFAYVLVIEAAGQRMLQAYFRPRKVTLTFEEMPRGTLITIDRH